MNVSYQPVSESSLCLDERDGHKAPEVDLQVLVHIFGDGWLRTPRPAIRLRSYPKIKMQINK